MKKFTLLLALVGFFAIGCADQTEVETPDGTDVTIEEPAVDMPDMEAEMDSLGESMDETMDAAEDSMDAALDGDADGDGQ
jgi:hypothetical protein